MTDDILRKKAEEIDGIIEGYLPVPEGEAATVIKAMNYSINVLTMFGLILVIGSLCDDAIVVVENSQALMEREGLFPKQAALKCMTQITGAIIATTLVTLACYAPLAFYQGMVGNIYRQFSVAMCVFFICHLVMHFSWLISSTKRLSAGSSEAIIPNLEEKQVD